MQNEMDNNDNLVIQGLEALLGGEDSAVNVSHSKSFEEMRTKFKESFSLDQSKDSGIAFSNLSFRHLPSVNTSIQNVTAFHFFFTFSNQFVIIICVFSNLWNLATRVICLIHLSVSSNQLEMYHLMGASLKMIFHP